MLRVAPSSPSNEPPEYIAHWEPDGTAKELAPRWARFRTEMSKGFPSPFRGETDDPLAKQIAAFVGKLDTLRPAKGGPAFLGPSAALAYRYPGVKNVKIGEHMAELDDVLDDVVSMFHGAPNWGSPLTMCNVNPQGNTAAIVASMMAQVFAVNMLEGEYAWNVHRAELETAGMMGNLFGWSPTNTGAIYTYGGGGCWTYGVKYGLTRVLKDSRQRGVRTDAKVICSNQAHYVQQNATDWLGLGMDNVVHVRTDPSTNQMDLAHLETLLSDFVANGVPVATVVCTMGTTDASAFDPIREVRALMDRYPNPEGYGKAVLYADAVVGWSWIFFKDYDFDTNPLQFSARTLPLLRQNGKALSELGYADAVGVDFHKAGWAPYVSSCFIYADSDEFEGLHRRGADAYLQQRTDYNPMYYTLEVSRTAAGALAGWATLRYFGIEGMQAILGGILESKVYFYDLLMREPDLVCVNAGDTGLVTLFRVYPKGVDAKAAYERELYDPSCRAELVAHNRLTEDVGDRLFEWFRTGKKLDGQFTPHMSFSTGFRPVNYNQDGADPDAVVYALKSFPMNVFVTPVAMQWAVYCVRAARDAVVAEGPVPRGNAG